MMARILPTAHGPAGAMVIRGQVTPLVMDALASLAAIAIDRYQSFEKEERAENAQKSEQLRAAVMDSLAHEFKTPLTSVQTASSGLLEFGGLNANQTELVTIIDEETGRMNALCTRLLMTAKLEPGKMPFGCEQVTVTNLLDELIENCKRPGETSRFRVSVEDPELTVCVDRGLVATILTQYIDNARKYSTAGTPIEIGARRSYNEALFSVHNFGPTIPLDDRERIFDRFYRSPDHSSAVAGTGIGLSVVRKAATAHHGHVWVVSDVNEGTTFFLSIPIDGRKS
jgi:two-component system sensor histidine kinase KdpD